MNMLIVIYTTLTFIYTRAVRTSALIFGLASCVTSTTAIAADNASNGRESGFLVNVADFAKLKDEITNSQQAAQQLVDASPVTTGRSKLNAMDEALDNDDDAAASAIYAEEMAAGRGPDFWRKQRAEFSAKESELLSHFDQLQRFHREARRAQPGGGDSGTSDKLDELARSIADSRGAVASGRLRAMLASAKKEREGALKEFVGKYRFPAVYLADSAANLPVDVIEEILISVVEKAVEMGDAAASAHRAESFMLAYPDEARRRAKQKAAGQTSKSVAGTRKLF